jgi:hypothetical protein
MLCLSDKTTKFLTIVIFVIVELQTVFHAQCIGMFIVCLYATFHQCIVIKPKAKKECLMATMLVFPILQKVTFTKNFFKICCYTYLKDCKLCVVFCCSHVTSTHIWCVVIVGYRKLKNIMVR